MTSGELDLFVRLLQVREASTTGILLAVILALIVSLNRGWLVTAGRHRDTVGAREACTKALELANTTLKTCERDYTEARISIARHEERESLWQWPKPGPQRKSRGT